MADVSRHQRTGCDRREEPQCCDRDGNNRRRRPDFFFPPHLGGFGKLTALGENVRWCNLPEQFYSKEENQQVVQEPNHRDKARDELNGTKKIASSACCYQPCIPTRAGVFEHKIENVCLGVESLNLLLPAHCHRRAFVHKVSRVVEVGTQKHLRPSSD
jgi:hypothetical protein